MIKGSILIVEDDFLVAERIRHVLSEAGYPIVGVTKRTNQAEDLLKDGKAGLAIVSMMLEVDVDGVRTATALQRRYGIKVLITTGFPDTFVKQHLDDRLSCATLKKPFSDDELLTAVAACLTTAA